MSAVQRRVLILSMTFAYIFGYVDNVYAMHIMEGYLPLSHSVIWSVICIPFLVIGGSFHPKNH